MNFEKEFNALKKKLEGAIKESLRDIEESYKELDVISDVMDKYPDKFTKEGGMALIVQDALDEAKALITEGEKLIRAHSLLNKGSHGR